MSDVRSIALAHPHGSTEILVGSGALAAAVERHGELVSGRAVWAVAAERIATLHGASLAPLAERAASLRWLSIPDGEAAKSLAVAERCWRQLAAQGAKRDSLIVAFGGGSTGDLAGFVAGTYLRGVDLLQLPTTLLAQVDAAIGGKAAIDLPEAKNAVGVLRHPLAVVAETRWLATLARADLRGGLVEAIKMAAVLDLDLLARIERDLDALLAGDLAALAPVIGAAAAAKARVVEADPEERGPRQVLNLGHTLGHALEAAAGFGPLGHGDAVAYGLLFSLRLGERHGDDGAFAERLRALVGRLELPPLPRLDPRLVLELVRRDKKAREAGLTWVFAAAPGRAERRLESDWRAIGAAIETFLGAPV